MKIRVLQIPSPRAPATRCPVARAPRWPARQAALPLQWSEATTEQTVAADLTNRRGKDAVVVLHAVGVEHALDAR
jgi:hypothetical protein